MHTQFKLTVLLTLTPIISCELSASQAALASSVALSANSAQVQQVNQARQESEGKKRKNDNGTQERPEKRSKQEQDVDVIDLTGEDSQGSTALPLLPLTSPQPLPILGQSPFPFSSAFSGLFGNAASRTALAEERPASSSSSSSSSSLSSPARLTPATTVFSYLAPAATSPSVLYHQRLLPLALPQTNLSLPMSISPLQLTLPDSSMSLANPSPQPTQQIAAAVLSAAAPMASSSSSSARSGLFPAVAAPQQAGQVLERVAQELFQKSLEHLRATNNIEYHQALAKKYRELSAKKEYELGTAYERGTYGQQDITKALAHFTHAAEQGLAEAQCKLGSFYEQGLSAGVATLVETNIQQAIEWYKKAFIQNYPPAREALKRCSERIQKLALSLIQHMAIEPTVQTQERSAPSSSSSSSSLPSSSSLSSHLVTVQQHQPIVEVAPVTMDTSSTMHADVHQASASAASEVQPVTALTDKDMEFASFLSTMATEAAFSSTPKPVACEIALALHATGKTSPEIAALFGDISAQTVNKLLQGTDAPYKKRMIFDTFNAMCRDANIAARWGLDTSTRQRLSALVERVTTPTLSSSSSSSTNDAFHQ